MKMNRPHLVPLSRQALAILQKLEPMTGCGRYLFPSVRSEKRPMSENTVNGALRRLGYTVDEMTGHGFRSMAAVRLNEMGKWSPDAIERQLAHQEPNAVRRAYTSQAEYLDERRRMMQSWADYLDVLMNGAEIVQLSKKSTLSAPSQSPTRTVRGAQALAAPSRDDAFRRAQRKG
jgi:integrase